MVQTALITGVLGQDGIYLAKLLVEKGYSVYGAIKPCAEGITDPRTTSLPASVKVVSADLTNPQSVKNLIELSAPVEIYNLAAQSSVAKSLANPESVADVTALGPLRILEVIRTAGMSDRVTFYQASSSEMFGSGGKEPFNENSPFRPRSPYAVAKLYAHWITVTYRELYGLRTCCGILFNHESEQRNEHYVSRKITKAVARISKGLQDELRLGHLDVARDWGYARDYVDGIWRMTQREHLEDFLLATGEAHTVREFVEEAFKHAGINLTWRGHDLDEVGIDSNGRVLVRKDPRFCRTGDPGIILGDSSKAKRLLGWKPTVTFKDLVKRMMTKDMANATMFSG